VIGVKVWIYRGDIYEQKRRQPSAVGTSVFLKAEIRVQRSEIRKTSNPELESAVI